MSPAMADVKVYHRQPAGPHRTVLVAFYERYREEKGSVAIPEMEAILFAEYLLAHMEEFQAELKAYTAFKWPDPPDGSI